MRGLSIAIFAIAAASWAVAGSSKGPAKEPEKQTGPQPVPAAVKISHAAAGAKATASSTSKLHDGEAGPEALVDGDLTTRWASKPSAPQRITINLEKEISIETINLHWEAAFATKYQILVSDDGEGWTPAHYFFRLGEKQDARVDTCSMKGVKARHILIELQERINDEWGFSLYEVEVTAAPAAPAAPPTP